ncbi:DUF4862 family protein [Tessaracoccus sp. HDW20]|nr:DUF4862 family protein [Tessaracoccus coleopterorum]
MALCRHADPRDHAAGRGRPDLRPGHARSRRPGRSTRLPPPGACRRHRLRPRCHRRRAAQRADPDRVARPLHRVSDRDRRLGLGSTQVVVEHSDAWSDEHPVEKGFLTLAEELKAAEAAGVGVAINWARSVIETRDAATGLAHVRQAAARGLLRGLMFSSVSPVDNNVGRGWVDSHLAPTGLSISPEGSLLTRRSSPAAARPQAMCGGVQDLGAGEPGRRGPRCSTAGDAGARGGTLALTVPRHGVGAKWR